MPLNKNIAVQRNVATQANNSFANTSSGGQQGYPTPNFAWDERQEPMRVMGEYALYGGLPVIFARRAKLNTGDALGCPLGDNFGSMNPSILGKSVCLAQKGTTESPIDFWTIYSGVNLISLPTSTAGQAQPGTMPNGAGGDNIGCIPIRSGAIVRLCADKNILGNFDKALSFDLTEGKIVYTGAPSETTYEPAVSQKFSGIAVSNMKTSGDTTTFDVETSALSLPAGSILTGVSNLTSSAGDGVTATMGEAKTDPKNPQSILSFSASVNTGTAGPDLTVSFDGMVAAQAQNDDQIIPLYPEFRIIEQVVGDRCDVVVADGKGNANFVPAGSSDAPNLILVNCRI